MNKQQEIMVNTKQLFKKDVYQRIINPDTPYKQSGLFDEQIRSLPDSQFHAALNLVDVHVSLIDRNSKVLWANRKGKELFGRDMVGKHCCEVYRNPSNICDDPLTCLTSRAFLNDDIQEHEIKLATYDGSEKYFEGRAQVISWDEDGTPQTIANVYKDITESKLAEEELELSMLKLQNTLAGTIEAMSKTVEIRDPYTAGHQKRTTEIARDIGMALGLDRYQMEGIKMAGAIHDLGKICIPAGILSKPGQINRSEFSLIKNHPQSGYDILKDIDFNTPVADIVLQHHERLDGSGYPFGLSGDDILIEAKVIGVADVIEAMASHRPYRPALGLDIAIDEIRHNKGTIYDPEVVNVAVDLFTDSDYRIAHA